MTKIMNTLKVCRILYRCVRHASDVPKIKPPALSNADILDRLIKGPKAPQVPSALGSFGGISLDSGDQVFRRSSSRYPFYQVPEPKGRPRQGTSALNLHSAADNFEVMCQDEKFNWNDPDTVQKISKLDLKFLTVQELKRVSENLFQISSKINNYVALKNLRTELDLVLSDLCESKVCQKDAFEFAAIIFRIFYMTKTNLRESVYLQEFVQRFVSNQSEFERLSSPELVFLLFVCGELRYIPGRENTSKNFDPHNGFEIPSHLESKLLSHESELTLGELGLIAHALHKSHIHISVRNKKLASLFYKAILNIPDQNVVSSQTAIISMAKLLREKGLDNIHTQFADKVMKKFAHQLHLLRPETKIRLLGTLYSGRPRHSDWFLLNVVQSFGDFKEIRLKDLEHLTFTLFFLHFKDQDNKTYNLILDAVDNFVLSDLKVRRSFVYLVSFLLKCGVYREDHIRTIIGAANANAQKILNCDHFDASISILQSFGSHRLNRLIHSYPNKERNKYLVQDIVVAIAEIDIGIEISEHDYLGPRLNPEVRRACLDFSLRAEESQNIVSEPERVRELILQQLNNLLGEQVYYGHLMPHSTYRDFAFCLDLSCDRLTAVDIDINEDILKSKVVRQESLDANHKWFALIAPKPELFSEGTLEPLGPVHHKSKQLQDLGYQTVIVAGERFLYMNQKKKSRNYLVGKIWPQMKKVKSLNKS